MMAEREEEQIDFISGLMAESDDASHHRRQSSKNKGAMGGSGHSVTHPELSAQLVRKPSMAGRFFTIFFIVILLATCSMLGWQLYLMQQKLIKNDAFVAQVNQQFDLLGHEMNQTGSSFAERGDATTRKFKFFDSEIRKLWDVSNKRNKGAIAANQSGLTQLKKEIGQVAADNKKMVGQQSAIDKRQGVMDKGLSRLNSQLVAENMTLHASIEDHSDQLLMVRGELEKLQRIFTAMPGNLSQRVKANTEAVEAIDAARSQMVNSITQLQNRVSQLQSSVGRSAPPVNNL